MADGNPNQKMTTFASRAVIVATAITARFKDQQFGAAVKRKVRVDEPEGPSTGGGKKARQPLSLVAVQAGAPALVCGFVDVVTNEAELRSYGALASRYFARHNLMPDVSEVEYNRFLEELRATLTAVGISRVELSHEEPPAAGPTAAAAGAAAALGGGSRNKALWAIGAVAVAVIVAALLSLR